MNRYTEPSGSVPLDDLIGGGYPRKMVSQIYGEPGSGKSTFCLLAAVHTLRQGRAVVYIDTESFSVDRFTQIAGPEAERLADRFYLYEPADFDQQAAMIADAEKLLNEKKAGLVVVDSATGLYRTEIEQGQDLLRRLTKQMIMLLGYAKRYDIPVIVTNQVYMDPVRNDYAPLGGTSLFHISKVVLRIDRLDGIRRIRIAKHHAKPEGSYLDFVMVEEGIQVTSGPHLLDHPGSRENE